MIKVLVFLLLLMASPALADTIMGLPRIVDGDSLVMNGAKTRQGTLCQNPAIKGRARCKLHGGLSTGPRTPEGKAGVAAAHTNHGRRSKAHVSKIRYINAELRRITYELKRDGFIP